jgi:tyrosinase
MAYKKRKETKGGGGGAEGYPAALVHSPRLEVGHIGTEFSRADIEFHGVDHSGTSFEARVFINRKRVTMDTELTLENGFAGRFWVFGHGGCWGGPGHCEIHQPRLFDPRPAHPLTPARKVVIATEALRGALVASPVITLTVLPVVLSATEKCDVEDVFSFRSVQVVAYD